MASPVVQTTSVGGATAATTTPTITLPTGIVAGDKVIIVHPVNEAGGVSTSITWPAGWTKPTNDSSETSGAQNALFIAYRDCDGTEGASISPTLTVAGNYSFACYRISGAPAGAPNVAVHVTDGGASPGAPDPPSLTPAGGAKDYLWIAVTGWDSGLNNWSANPANYTTNVLHFDSSNVAAVAIAGVATGTRQLNAASDDPGAFTLTANDQFCATTIAVAGTDSTVAYPPTKRPSRFNGPYDANGFLLSPYRRYDFTPSVQAGTPVTVLTDVGSLVLAGFIPVVDSQLNTGVGSLTLDGFLPTIGLAFNTGVGALTLTGLSPVIDSKLNTGLGALILTGLAPALDSKISTGAGGLTLSGFSPLLDSKINADVGALTLGGFIPSVLIGTNIQTDFGVLTLAGLAPVLNTSIGTDVGSLIFAGLAPDIQGIVPPVVENPRTSPGGGTGRRRARRVIEAPDLSNVKNLTELYRALNYPQAPKVVALPVTKTVDDSEMQEIIAVYFALLDAEDLN